MILTAKHILVGLMKNGDELSLVAEQLPTLCTM